MVRFGGEGKARQICERRKCMNPPPRVHEPPAKRRDRGTRCRECVACLADDCGECADCRRMVKFGGDGMARRVR
eukprot:scaffold23211_cov69-Phaeocystis_antarctica.AAC.1